MEFTNFEQMSQLITAASGMLSQILLWVLSGLVLALSVCSIGGALGQCWREGRQPQHRNILAQVAASASRALALPQVNQHSISRSGHSLWTTH